MSIQHLAPSLIQPPPHNLRNELLRTQRALMSVPLLIDPTRGYTRTRSLPSMITINPSR